MQVCLGSLPSCKNGNVTFSYKDNDTKEQKKMTLPVLEFTRRFLQHVLPKGAPLIPAGHTKHQLETKLFTILLNSSGFSYCG